MMMYAYRLKLPDSELRGPILGLNLLYLLVENRLAEFHSEVWGEEGIRLLPIILARVTVYIAS